MRLVVVCEAEQVEQPADVVAVLGGVAEHRRVAVDHVAVAASMALTRSAADERRVIGACGELDVATAAQLEERLAGNIDTVLDLSELSFIDSTGLRVLVSTAHRAQAEAWEFTVRNPRPTVLRVIKLVALEQLLGLESRQAPASQRERAAQ